MASFIDLTWNNPYFVANETELSLTQELERKIGTATTWTKLTGVTITKGTGTAFTATDSDVTKHATDDEEYKYRVVTVNSTTRTNGNEITVTVPSEATVTPVSNLEGTFREE